MAILSPQLRGAAVAVVALTLIVSPARATADSGSSAPAAHSVATTPPAAHQGHHDGGVQHVSGVPLGAPKAALAAEPKLPEPTHHAWPFPNGFSRTSGTGRLAGGASLWTDWVYDDHGATAPTGAPVSPAALTSSLAPTQGVAAYPPGPAKGNGADIFRAAIGLTNKATYWRVDWNTLVSDRVPIAEWAFDTDDRASTGTSQWPAGAGVHSQGIDKALVVSSQHVELIDTKTGKKTDVLRHGGRLVVDHKARSFIVRIPRRLMPVHGHWRVRLASGLATPNGKAFAQPDYSASLDMTAAQEGALPRVFNVTFRSLHQEPPVYRNGSTDAQEQTFDKSIASTPLNAALGLNGLGRFVTGNFWMEDHQADVLASGGNVSAFARTVAWSRLAHHASTPQPHPRGYSNRWYVSRLHLGQGMVQNPVTQTEGDLKPNYLGRVQPYAVYVPHHVSLHHKLPLTWILHSLSVNLNQYGALDPHLLKQMCQHRHSICATTEGFGPDGWYYDQAEQDFWSVWHALATSYRLDPHRTVLSGYSMGGWATYKLGLAHPDLFSQAMPLEGPPDCGIRILELDGQQLTVPAGTGSPHCSKDGSTTPLLGNARWLPYVVTQGGIDELVPAPSNLQATNDLQHLGYRYTLFFLPANDHLVYATQDRFGGVVAALGKHIPKVRRNPARIDYAWYPNLNSRRLGIGATTAYWLSHLHASTSAPGAIASIRAHSQGIDDPAVTPVDHGPTLVQTPPPATKTWLTWRRGARPATRDRLTLTLTKVEALTVDAARARLRCPRVSVSSSRSVRVTLVNLRPGGMARIGGHSYPVGPTGRVTLRFPKGSAVAHVHCG